ncbi:phosphatidylinositol mannoside acyltransferase [Nostocoides australiense]|nr:phosphatidylinositol mannoside acyltransferase [Tetrasphaera australiensis]HRW02658.1 phosphatidylinositol mannoside acyltransferase [Tetrasphaera sp.]
MIPRALDPRRLGARAGDEVTIAGYRLGWAGVRALPEGAAYRLFDQVADALVRRGGKGVQRLRSNYARVRPELGPRELDALVREGMRAYMRYYCEAFRLPTLTAEQVAARVRVRGDGPVRTRLAAGRPVVAFLGHMGNWDLAGAWCCAELGTVVTVAEKLEPEAVFREFLAFRESLGMRIIPLGADTFPRLRQETRGPVVVPLLADRDLTGGGMSVDFCGHQARMAVGPAALALATGSALHPVSIRHERRDGGWGILVTFHDEIPVPASGTTREKTAAMTQGCADVLGGVIRRHTADWHMLQRVFADDLDGRR